MSLLGDLLGGVDNTFNALIGNQTITGSAGNDLINSLLGDNVLNGGAGNDIVSYAGLGQGVVANLLQGTVSDLGGTATDTLTSVENVIGSNFGDTLVAGAANFLAGGLGDDTLQSLLGGNTLDGGGGVDTASFLGQTVGEVASLLTGTALGDGTDVLAGIENLTGTDFGDTLIGSLGDNVLDGGLGDDLLSGAGGVDSLIGGLGFDMVDFSEAIGPVDVDLAQGDGDGVGISLDLSGIEGAIGSGGDDLMRGDLNANSLDGGEGDDTLEGGLGDDTLNGGAGDDTASYADATAGVTVDLQTNRSSGAAGADTLISIENIIGSDFADTLSGDSFANHLQGGGGDDLLNGRAAADVLDGGTGTDTASYADAGGAVVVDLADGTATGAGGADSLVSIESAIGSAFADTLSGDANANHLWGLAGADLLRGGEGDDTLDGGTGADTATYADATAAVLVSLATGRASGGAGSDSLVSIENVIGSSFGDALFGNANANVLSGGGGDDILAGRGNGDTLNGGSGSDTARYLDAASAVSVDLAAGAASGGSGNDSLISIENVDGSRFADTLTGDGAVNVLRGFGGDDLIVGGLGNDVLNGGGGRDWVTYQGAADKVAVDLSEGFAKGGDGHDILRKIEDVTGSDFNDALTGDAKHNVIDGGGGNDRITGGFGHDILTGGGGADRFIFTAVSDSAKHGGYDLITDLQGVDTIDLSKIDADATTDGDQAFHMVDHFSHHAGEMTLAYKAKDNVTLVNLDVDGDGKADAVIHITGDVTSFEQFIL